MFFQVNNEPTTFLIRVFLETIFFDLFTGIKRVNFSFTLNGVFSLGFCLKMVIKLDRTKLI